MESPTNTAAAAAADSAVVSKLASLSIVLSTSLFFSGSTSWHRLSTRIQDDGAMECGVALMSEITSRLCAIHASTVINGYYGGEYDKMKLRHCRSARLTSQRSRSRGHARFNGKMCRGRQKNGSLYTGTVAYHAHRSGPYVGFYFGGGF